jgi:hypothetical protein
MKALLLPLILALPLHASESGIEKLQKALAGRAEAFDRIELKADGTTVRFEVKLGEETANLEGAVFDGFRFRCPEDVSNRDFVWYFNSPEAWGEWYILPVEGEPGRAFNDWIDADRLYQPFDKPSEKDRLRILQTLDGGYFKPGGDYIMWFRNTGKSGAGSLRGTAAFLDKNDSWDADDIEKALSLKPAPAGDQVTALNSRGGLILLDNRFFDRDYATGRIDSALMSIRRTKRMSGGFFLTIQTFVPSCKTKPSMEEIIKEHGPANFIRTSAEKNRVRSHAGADDADGDDDEDEITSYHYDHFAFEVDGDGEDRGVRRVATFGCNFADVAPPAKGTTFGAIDIENLTVFHRDGKEVGRAYYFLEGAKKPLFITEPPAGEYRNGNVFLISEGGGKWKWENRFPDGKTARRVPLEQDVFNGLAEGFHPNGKNTFKVTYRNGELDGDAIQFDEEGNEISRRSFKDGKEVTK